MELLHSDQLQPEPGERVFRHGVLGPIVLLAIFATPLLAVLVFHERLLASAHAASWLAWLGISPILLVGGLLYAIVLQALAQVAWRAFLPSNWLMRLSSGGLVLNLRSFQNTHFPDDGPTVVRFAWPEIARVREVRDTRPATKSEAMRTLRWLEIELAGVETGPLARLVDEERTRPGPRKRTLGVSSSGRFGHVPVFVAKPGTVRTDWLGRAVLRTLEAHTTVAERRDLSHARLRLENLRRDAA